MRGTGSKRLSVVGRAFRSLKTVDLKVRPIHYRLADRVRAHAFLCMLADRVEWHMRQRLALILFDVNDKEDAKRRRTSIVAPAPRSIATEEKAFTKRTRDGLHALSFQQLLEHLRALVRDTMRPTQEGLPDVASRHL